MYNISIRCFYVNNGIVTKFVAVHNKKRTKTFSETIGVLQGRLLFFKEKLRRI